MADLFDTTQIPDNGSHWDALAERVAANAARKSTSGGLHWFAHSRVSWVAACLLFAAAVAFTSLPAQNRSVRTFSAEWSQALGPSDDVGRVIVSANGPPAIGALLLRDQPGNVR